jgi:FdhE protein
MTQARAPQFDPIHIGDEAKPPLAVTPTTATLFRDRAERFAALAPGHALEPYLKMLAGLARAQHETLQGSAMQSLPPVRLPETEDLRRAAEFGMPPIAPSRLELDATVEATLDRFFDLASAVAMPEAASEALTRVVAADEATRREMVFAALALAIPAESLAEHVFVGAALQVHFARLAAALDAEALVPVADGACPACGSPPVTTGIVGWPSAHGTRFCTCWLCATRWHAVRVKCVLCSSTKGIAYQQIEGVADTIRAETCDECQGYVKILTEIQDPALDPVADDVASLGLDRLVKEAGWRRGSVNLFMLGS